jgi:hypothetical protein
MPSKSNKKPRAGARSRPASAGPELERRALSLPRSVLSDAEAVLFRLRQSGQKVSFSAYVEVALKELGERRDLADVLARHDAKARR